MAISNAIDINNPSQNHSENVANAENSNESRISTSSGISQPYQGKKSPDEDDAVTFVSSRSVVAHTTHSRGNEDVSYYNHHGNGDNASSTSKSLYNIIRRSSSSTLEDSTSSSSKVSIHHENGRASLLEPPRHPGGAPPRHYPRAGLSNPQPNNSSSDPNEYLVAPVAVAVRRESLRNGARRTVVVVDGAEQLDGATTGDVRNGSGVEQNIGHGETIVIDRRLGDDYDGGEVDLSAWNEMSSQNEPVTTSEAGQVDVEVDSQTPDGAVLSGREDRGDETKNNSDLVETKLPSRGGYRQVEHETDTRRPGGVIANWRKFHRVGQEMIPQGCEAEVRDLTGRRTCLIDVGDRQSSAIVIDDTNRPRIRYNGLLDSKRSDYTDEGIKACVTASHKHGKKCANEEQEESGITNMSRRHQHKEEPLRLFLHGDANVGTQASAVKGEGSQRRDDIALDGEERKRLYLETSTSTRSPVEEDLDGDEVQFLRSVPCKHHNRASRWSKTPVHSSQRRRVKSTRQGAERGASSSQVPGNISVPRLAQSSPYSVDPSASNSSRQPPNSSFTRATARGRGADITRVGVDLRTLPLHQIPPLNPPYPQSSTPPPSTPPTIQLQRSGAPPPDPQTPPPVLQSPTTTTDHSPTLQPWPPHLYASLALSLQHNFPFTAFAHENGVREADIKELFSENVQVPLLRAGARAGASSGRGCNQSTARRVQKRSARKRENATEAREGKKRKSAGLNGAVETQ
jgi:hypothetical protein